MISFDRRTGNVNLTPIWNEINSIKVDTLSLYTMITAGGGGDIPQELLNSITLLNSNTDILSSDIISLKSNTDILSSSITSINNNTLYFNNELFSLKTNTLSMVSDTNSLNMDVVSLYNICSSLSDSISTITGGGGGGGMYYLALSDAVNSSLSFVYNMTGNIASLPNYDNFTFMGDLGTFEAYSVLNKSFKLHGLKSMASLTFSTAFGNVFSYVDIAAKTMFQNTFSRYFDRLKIQCESFWNNKLITISNLYLSADTLNGMSLTNVSGIINASSMVNCSLTVFAGNMNVNVLSRNTLKGVKCPISADVIAYNAITHYHYKDICAFNSIAFNTFEIEDGDVMPNFYAPIFDYNRFTVCTGDFSISANNIIANTISLYSAHGATYSDHRIDLICNDICSGDRFYNINTLILSGKIQGSHVFSRISELKFYATQFTLGGGREGGIANAYSNITLLDFRGLTPTTTYESIIFTPDSVIGVQTMKVNYDVSFSLGEQKIQPTNIYTVDFYKCDNYISNSIFTIPNYYSSYDESNVWISGKPLLEYNYTLSVSS